MPSRPLVGGLRAWRACDGSADGARRRAAPEAHPARRPRSVLFPRRRCWRPAVARDGLEESSRLGRAACLRACVSLAQFPADREIDEIFKIFQLLGTPTEARWPGVSAMPDYGKIELPVLEPARLEEYLPGASAAAVALVRKLLAYDPAARPTATGLLHEPDEWLGSLPLTPQDELLRGFEPDDKIVG